MSQINPASGFITFPQQVNSLLTDPSVGQLAERYGLGWDEGLDMGQVTAIDVDIDDDFLKLSNQLID